MLLTSMLVILDAGSIFIDADGAVTMVICMLFSALMLLSILMAVAYGVGRHFLLKYRKQFRPVADIPSFFSTWVYRGLQDIHKIIIK